MAHRSRWTSRQIRNAKWGRGPAAGRTGNVFTDDPFFNPWAPGGDSNKGSARPSYAGGGYDEPPNKSYLAEEHDGLVAPPTRPKDVDVSDVAGKPTQTRDPE